MLKVTYFWSQTAGRVVGWSENFWAVGNSIGDSERNAASVLLGNLYNLKGHQTVSLGYRLSLWNADGTPTRTSQLITPFLTPRDNPNSTSNYASDFPTVAYLLQATGATPVRSTRQWVRGIIDDSIVDGGRITPFVAANARNAVLATLRSNPWGMRSRVQGGNPKIIVRAFDSVTSTFTTAAAHGFAVDQRVSLTGVSTSPPLAHRATGVYTVASIPTPTSFTLLGYILPEGTTVVIGRSAKVQKLEFAVFTANWEFLRATSRQAGRPFGSPSGRPRRAR